MVMLGLGGEGSRWECHLCSIRKKTVFYSMNIFFFWLRPIRWIIFLLSITFFDLLKGIAAKSIRFSFKGPEFYSQHSCELPETSALGQNTGIHSQFHKWTHIYSYSHVIFNLASTHKNKCIYLPFYISSRV